MAAKIDRENRSAEQVNPEKSGIRSGNPQLRTGDEPSRSAPSAKRPPARRTPD